MITEPREREQQLYRRAQSTPLLSMQGLGEDSRLPGRRQACSHQTPHLPAAWSWTSIAQNCERRVSVVPKTPSLRCSVIDVP